ncbi:MAG TPA: VOC family protein [Candidatus Eisenbacteria bacterium]|nr:VOC family protein [Candidatus Eisenbacteria bacterium]
MNARATAQVDHLVVAASDLGTGADWCMATLGLPPGPGGRHALMGTHNRLLPLASVAHPQAYLEIIAIDPEAPGPAPGPDGSPRRRWFDLDDDRVRQSLPQRGPHMIHWVCAVPDIEAATAALARQGIDRGLILDADRPTPNGVLRWRIAVRPDGQRLFDGLLPTLIEWRSPHPVRSMAPAPLGLRQLSLQHPQAVRLREALDAIGAEAVPVSAGPPALVAHIDAPLGSVVLGSGD